LAAGLKSVDQKKSKQASGDMKKVDPDGRDENPQGQVICESRLAWNPGPLPTGRVSLLDTLVGENGDGVIEAFYGSLLRQESLDLVPTMTLPDETERSVDLTGFQLCRPFFKTNGATVRILGKKALLWRIEAKYYLDQYLWVRIRHSGVVQTYSEAKVSRGDWHMIELVGQATSLPWPATLILYFDAMPHFSSGDTGAWTLDLSLGPTEAGMVLSVKL
jgi:hypothetical protein